MKKTTIKAEAKRATPRNGISDIQIRIAVQVLVDCHGPLRRDLLVALVQTTIPGSGAQFDRVTGRMLSDGALLLQATTRCGRSEK
jgi:hypothetical protein